MMKKTVMALAAGAFVMMLAPGAQALTPAPLGTPSDVIQVAQGCGPGWHRGPRGRCIRNYVGRPVVVCRSVRTPYGWRRVCR